MLSPPPPRSDHRHERIRVLLIVEKAHEPRVRRAVADLGGAGLGADVETGEVMLGVVGRDGVVAHQLPEARRGRAVHVPLGDALRAVVYELRLDEHAAVCHGANKAQHRVRAHKVRRLPDARPADLRITHKLRGVIASGGRYPVETLPVEKAVLAHVVDHRVLPKPHRERGERAVAGIRERLFKILLPVRRFAGDGHARDLGLALAVKALVE